MSRGREIDQNPGCAANIIKSPDELWERLKALSRQDAMVQKGFTVGEALGLSREHLALVLAVCAFEDRQNLMNLLLDAERRAIPKWLL